MKELIYHVDVNNAFLSWEAAYRVHHLGGTLDLRTISSAICGDIRMRHGIILAKSIPAKKYGIQTGMSVIEAKRKCPELYMAPPNYSLYMKCSEAFFKILREYTPDVEQYSIDEGYMNMTQTIHLFGNPVEVANQIKDRIREELGFTVNVGISTNKLLAKMAGELKKPDMVHTLYPEEIISKMWPLPVSELFFVGRATTKKLQALGIQTIGDLAKADSNILKSHLKKHGELIWKFANGIDCSEVTGQEPPQKGYGNSTTTPYDVADLETAEMILLALAETVAARLRENHVQAEILSVGIKNYDMRYASHQMILRNPTDITWEVYQYACELFEQLWDFRTPIRHLGIYASRLHTGTSYRQIDLFEVSDCVKLTRLDQTIDKIRKRYGIDAVKRAVFVKKDADEHPGERRIDHMEGGISREKRTVDYSKVIVE